ncbi:MAG TPA: carboxypeptidase-like regulatory domain-containing protein [Polyangiaceae bacterium]|nr:carboxypeptidase-like regulatory domain-containing protein [Polyangiaceae bacterium]
MGSCVAGQLRASLLARLAALALLTTAAPIRAAEPALESMIGDTAWALPGVVRVGVPATAGRRLAVAGSAGYGLTEAQSENDGAHHRVLASAAIAYAAVPNLELALRFDGRYDRHPDDAQGSDSGLVGDPRIKARFGSWFTKSLSAGVEAGIWVPGKDAPSFALDATTPEASLIAAWMPRAGSLLGASLGFRLDRSENAAPDPARLRFGDRLALGVSEFNAVLAGVGTSISLGSGSALLAEVSWDLLVGSGAPSALESPLRADLGFRKALRDDLSFELLGEAALSQRPSIGPEDPLVNIEPRFSVLAGLRYRFAFDRRAAPVATKVRAKPAPTSPEPSLPKKTEVTFQIEDEKGAPLAGAKVEIVLGDSSKTAEDLGDGRYRAADLPPGSSTIRVTLEGYEPIERPLMLEGAPALDLELKMQESLPSGQLRGLIRSFSGRGVSASIVIESLGKQVNTDEQGYFTLDVPPGQYQVRVVAPGFKAQTRKIRVQQNGVTVLNAELFEAR